MGDGFAVQLARMQNLPSASVTTLIETDVRRTFPRHPVQAEAKNLCEILAMFAKQHPQIAYAQGQAFLCIPIFWIYWKDAPSFAVKDTLFSLGRLHRICRPLYPLHKNDNGPVKFCSSIASCLSRYFSNWTEECTEYAKSFILHFWGCLFANLFSMEDVLILWEYILEPTEDRSRMLRLFKFTLALIRKHERIMDFGPVEAFQFLSHPSVHDVPRLITSLQEHDREDTWPTLPST